MKQKDSLPLSLEQQKPFSEPTDTGKVQNLSPSEPTNLFFQPCVFNLYWQTIKYLLGTLQAITLKVCG